MITLLAYIWIIGCVICGLFGVRPGPVLFLVVAGPIIGMFLVLLFGKFRMRPGEETALTLWTLWHIFKKDKD